MAKVLKEIGTGRCFSRSHRWNEIEYTVIAPNNRNAAYADNFGKGEKKLFLTYIRYLGKVIPLNKFSDLPKAIRLDGNVMLTRMDQESGLYLEFNPDKQHVRVYMEVPNED